MKIFTSLFLAIFLHQIIFAAAPTVTGSNLSFSALDGKQFSGSFTAGNGTQRIVVMKAGSPVTGLPVNGVDYAYNSAFGTAGSAFTAPGEFVVYKTTANSFSVSNLSPSTTYYIAVFEYNGAAAATQYLMLPLTGSQITVSAPTVPVTAISATAKTGNTITLKWTNGNGSGRLVVARKNGAVNESPIDLTNYFQNENFGSGTKLGTDNFVVYKGTGNTATVKALEPNIDYHFAIFEYNGSSSPMHLVPAALFSTATNAGPNIAPSSPGFNYVEGNSFYFAVGAGNGNRRLFIGRKEAAVTASPVTGTSYVANAAFGTPGTEIAPGEFVLSAGTANSIKVTNLEPNTTYHFRVFEFDADAAGNAYYLTSSFATRSGSTCTTPTQPVSNFNLVNVTGNSATISYTIGTGSYRHVLMKAGSAVDAAPSNLVKYTGSPNFGSGQQLGTGNFCLFSGINGNQFTVNNLQPGVTYHLAIYDFNGNEAPVYSATAGVFSFTVPAQPTVAAKNPWTTSIDGNPCACCGRLGTAVNA